jgi:hypothetical protein
VSWQALQYPTPIVLIWFIFLQQYRQISLGAQRTYGLERRLSIFSNNAFD